MLDKAVINNAFAFSLAEDSLTKGKKIAGFAAGTFVSMLGRRISVKEDDISIYLDNTLERISSLKDKDFAGLPIDEEQHDMGKAAGWIVGAEAGTVTNSLDEEVAAIFFEVEWTEAGVDLIENKQLVNFSPMFDPANKVIVGGSLTNYPATKDEDGIPLFDAIQLAEGIYALGLLNMQDESLDQKSQRVRDSWYAEFGYNFDTPIVYEVFDEFIIIKSTDGFNKVDFSDNDEGEIEFQEVEDWTKVKQEWVELQAQRHQEKNNDPKNKNTQGGSEMKYKLEDLSPEDLIKVEEKAREAVLAEFGKTEEETDEEAIARLKEAINLEAFAEVGSIDEARAALTDQYKAALTAEYKRLKANAGTMLAGMMAEIKRTEEIAAFSEKVTKGTDDVPHGFPVTTDEMITFLQSLDDRQRTPAYNLFKRIWKDGMVEFSEKGHGKRVEGMTPLPAEYAAKMDSGEFTLADLSSPYLGLGDISIYDLAKWKEE